MPGFPGSFRNPCEYFVEHQGRVFRALDPAATALLKELDGHGHLAGGIQDGGIVGTRIATGSAQRSELAAARPGFAAFVEHDRIAPITYFREWSAAMLADAGRLTRRFQGDRLKLGLSLKDADDDNLLVVRRRPP